jgi:hypothetical protein
VLGKHYSLEGVLPDFVQKKLKESSMQLGESFQDSSRKNLFNDTHDDSDREKKIISTLFHDKRISVL